jgi:hypothetical protein
MRVWEANWSSICSLRSSGPASRSGAGPPPPRPRSQPLNALTSLQNYHSNLQPNDFHGHFTTPQILHARSAFAAGPCT